MIIRTVLAGTGDYRAVAAARAEAKAAREAPHPTIVQGMDLGRPE
jgi:hypothetical protein